MADFLDVAETYGLFLDRGFPCQHALVKNSHYLLIGLALSQQVSEDRFTFGRNRRMHQSAVHQQKCLRDSALDFSLWQGRIDFERLIDHVAQAVVSLHGWGRARRWSWDCFVVLVKI